MKNGSLYCMLAIALNISDLDISTIPVIELFAKITSSVLQRIDAEKTLQEKDDLNALIFNSVSDAVITLDTQGGHHQYQPRSGQKAKQIRATGGPKDYRVDTARSIWQL